MIDVKKMVCLTLLIFLATQSHAGKAIIGTVKQIAPRGNGIYFILNNTTSCPTKGSRYLFMSFNKTDTKSNYALLLMAAQTQKPITVYLTDQECLVQTRSRTVRYINMNF